MAKKQSPNPGLRGEVFEGEKKYAVSDEAREHARVRSIDSARRKRKALSADELKTPPQVPRLAPADLMPVLPGNGLKSLSLFSGGGGLDIGFERAGFEHVASYDYNTVAGETLSLNRPEWAVFSGEEGNVIGKDWKKYAGKIDVVHGGPPCQPFSMAGLQRGADDERDMFPEFVRAVTEILPRAFVAENVPALLQKKFQGYVKSVILDPLQKDYVVTQITLFAHSFGVPQQRKRVFFVGLRQGEEAAYSPPAPTHTLESCDNVLPGFADALEPCPRLRWALGLDDIGTDDIAPTMRSTLTGPRHTTSILSSAAAQRKWEALEIWPNGVGRDRVAAYNFPTKNGHFRLSVPDCKIIQGFPNDWEVLGATYMALGLIGNAVPPPLAYRVARSVADALEPTQPSAG